MNDATYKELISYTNQELAHFVTGRLPHLDAQVCSAIYRIMYSR